jgi:hypothetical protein
MRVHGEVEKPSERVRTSIVDGGQSVSSAWPNGFAPVDNIGVGQGGTTATTAGIFCQLPVHDFFQKKEVVFEKNSDISGRSVPPGGCHDPVSFLMLQERIRIVEQTLINWPLIYFCLFDFSQ